MPKRTFAAKTWCCTGERCQGRVGRRSERSLQVLQVYRCVKATKSLEHENVAIEQLEEMFKKTKQFKWRAERER